MKRWMFFIGSVAVMGWALNLAIHKNLAILEREKQAASEAEAVPAVSPAPEVPAPAPAEAVPPPAPAAVEAPPPGPVPEPPPFLDQAVSLVKLYREGNQKFLREDFAGAQRLFQKVLDRAVALEAGAPGEKELKKSLTGAAEARLRSNALREKILNSSDSREIQVWWEENIALLKSANESIARVIWLAGQTIREGQDAGAGDHGDVLLKDLETYAKGILVVSKSAHS
ncbi:MAG: hypothetical protein HY714_03400 [Candidatus Omnitrophica bacterium]|nr:hypothetical protein [Candidatus Omnitrophota bacterium]